MDNSLPSIYLARHGETEWSGAGRHTGLVDLPLTGRGEDNARRLGGRLKGHPFTAVFVSPLRRALRTCELAGFGAVAKEDADLVEWDYGTYAGKTTAEIHQQRPGWELFRDGCPGGESLPQITERAKRIIARVRAVDGDVLLFSHRYFLRVFAACWLGVDPALGRGLLLGTTALSIVGYDTSRTIPVIDLWNDHSHAH